MRVGIALSALWLVLAFSSCARHHVKVVAPYPHDPVQGPSWAYREVAPNKYVVYAANGEALNEVKHVIGCGTCVIQPIGLVYAVDLDLASVGGHPPAPLHESGKK